LRAIEPGDAVIPRLEHKLRVLVALQAAKDQPEPEPGHKLPAAK